MKKSTFCLTISFIFAICCRYATADDNIRIEEAANLKPSVVVELWPGMAPGEKGGIEEEKTEPRNPDEKPQVLLKHNVTKPNLSVFKPVPEKDTGASVIIFPGGGYSILAWDLEGVEVANWLNSIGVTGIVCKYRVPRRVDLPMHVAPLQDAQRAVRMVRANAEKWGLDPERVGVLGFSAGGHLTVMTATAYDTKAYEPIDEIDKLSARPNFAIPIYPAYLRGERAGGNAPSAPLSDNIKITKDTPPFFISITDDDPVGSLGAVKMYVKMKETGVPCELHVFVKGGHGYGLRYTHGRQSEWDKLCTGWLDTMGFLKKRE